MSELPSPSLGLMALGHCRGRLRRAATFLRKIGIDIAFQKEKSRARTRTVTITTIQPSAAPEEPGAQPSALSASSANPGKAELGNGFSAQSARTQTSEADAKPRRADGSGQGDDQTDCANPLENNAGTAADGADANRSPRSAVKKNDIATGWRTRI